jgi:hypothetical protein
MSHKRQSIRDAIVALLTGLATTGTRIYSGRVYPSGSTNVPGLNVTTPEERKSGTFPSNRKAQIRELTVMIEARVKPADGADSPQDQLDDIEAEVQAALMADVTLGGLVLQGSPGDSSFSLSGKMERPIGYARMEWICEYHLDWTT